MELLEKLEKYLPMEIGDAVEESREAVRDFALHTHLSHWHPISTAPYNQQLELGFVLDGQISILEFPCLRTNADEWINVDLGSKLKIEPVQWRIWQHEPSPEPHLSKITPGNRSALFCHAPPRLRRHYDPGLSH